MATKSGGGRAKQFQSEWTLKFGLEVCTRNPSTSEVSSVVCLFCRHFGREEEDFDQRKRKRTANPKFFSQPWRSDNFTTHLRQQHPVKWNEYLSLALEDKQKFFVCHESPEVVNLRSFVQPEGSMKARVTAQQRIKFVIDADIMETIIFGSRLFWARTNATQTQGRDGFTAKRFLYHFKSPSRTSRLLSSAFARNYVCTHSDWLRGRTHSCLFCHRRNKKEQYLKRFPSEVNSLMSRAYK